MTPAIREIAPAKVNLVLRIGPVAPNGLHEVCSLFASLELHDIVEVEESDADSVECEGVEGPNLAEAAINEFRRHRPLPPLAVRIQKRIPVAAGLGGGSADAAAVLRAANQIGGMPFEDDILMLSVAQLLGSDVPSQVIPGAWVVVGTGEHLMSAPPLPPMTVLLVPAKEGLSTADVFREADRLRIPRPIEREEQLALIGRKWEDARSVAEALVNDLQDAALSLRPELADTIEAVRNAGALGAQVSGSGPTVFGVFEDDAAAEAAALRFPGALVTRVAP